VRDFYASVGHYARRGAEYMYMHRRLRGGNVLHAFLLLFCKRNLCADFRLRDVMLWMMHTSIGVAGIRVCAAVVDVLLSDLCFTCVERSILVMDLTGAVVDLISVS
jgi:hypothetical protein